ncbi:MAG: fumarylacetoacetase [Candidatus Electryonea clarkiae]|nr:fumarylacetoacetase [Candidatus Electryonea clarkiae]MDP8286741.1 fumarylacetoacetase [Candidatus Electryonea clarkiae]
MVNSTSKKSKSFINVDPKSHFPIQNLPYGVFKPSIDSRERVGVAIGDYVLDLSVLERNGLFSDIPLKSENLFSRSTLNEFMSLGSDVWTKVRRAISNLLSFDEPILRDNESLRKEAFFKRDAVEMCMPVDIGDYTDFYASKYHAQNVGTMFRGAENALMPNYLHMPIGYHGRSSSIVISGTDIHRPMGQTKDDSLENPSFGASRMVDYELEMGAIIGAGNPLGTPVNIDNAHEHIFGLVLVNDWSARDIQKWEYQPLGPFLAKNFATSISPWVVTLDALEQFRIEGEKQDPQPLDYLKTEKEWAFNINLEVTIQGDDIKSPQIITRSNMRHLYWNIAQQLAHHTITGCNLRPGDMLATGTISGPDKNSRGCMLELTWKGTEPLSFPNGVTRKFIQDNDQVSMTGWCQGEDYRIGFGEVTGKLLKAK